MREARTPISVGARMQSDAGWTDVQILNVSSRGLMCVCVDPPFRGVYIEVRRQNTIIIGRVAWQSGQKFGLQSQDRIDIGSLVNEIRSPERKGERRTRPRLDTPTQFRPIDYAVKAERNRFIGRAINFAFVTVVCGLGALVIAAGVNAVLAQPMHEVRNSLAAEGDLP